MVPIGTLLMELWQFNAKFVIIYDALERKTKVLLDNEVVSSADHIDSAIFYAWNAIFGNNLLEKEVYA